MLSSASPSNCPQADRYGITSSLLCAIHCAISPVIIIFSPALSLWWSSTYIHIIGACIVVPLALLALLHGRIAHRKNWPVAFGLLGSAGVIIALSPIWMQLHPIIITWGNHNTPVNETALTYLCCPNVTHSADGGALSIPWQSILTLIGSLFLIIGHVGNIMYSHHNNTVSDSQQYVDLGVTHSQQVKNIFTEIKKSMEDTTQLVEVVNQTNTEQARGIQETSLVVNEILQGTHSNLENTRSNAGLCNTMTELGEHLNTMVNELHSIVKGDT